MPPLQTFDETLTARERRALASLRTPRDIQAFLDEIPYSSEPDYRSPRRVLRDRAARCFDGALFGAAALRRLGYPPLILDMVPNARDDGHVLALCKQDGHWGAVAKSNFAGLRFREPVYRTLRELVMSYFEQYYNVEREKTLRAYSVPLDLTRHDHLHWMISDDALERLADRLDRARRVPLLTPAMARKLALVDDRSYEAGLLGACGPGLYRPPRASAPRRRERRQEERGARQEEGGRVEPERGAPSR